MRSISFGLVAAALAAMLATTAAAQDTRGVQPPKAKADAPKDQASAKAAGMAEVPPLLQQAGQPCAVTDAEFRGNVRMDVNGKMTKTKVYEVACSDGLGYFIQVPEGNPPRLYDCLAVASAKLEDTACTLPANAEPHKSLQPVAAKAGLQCTVNQARYAGTSVEGKFNQYEVGCSEGAAYFLQVPQGGSTHPLTAIDCVRLVGGTNACTYLTKEAAVQRIAALAPPTRKACQTSDVRFIGEVPGKAVFYEVACTDGKSGYVLQTDQAGKYMTDIDCARAVNIGGGCKLTTVALAAGEETGVYTGLMSKYGYPCTVSNYRPLGLEPNTGREIVEVMCNGKPSPSVAFLPASAGQKTDVWDCARAEARGLACALSKGPASYAYVNEKIKAAGKECTVEKVRPVGSTAEGGDFVEVGCQGGGALMIEYGPGLQTVKSVLNCGEAKSVGGGCKFITIK